MSDERICFDFELRADDDQNTRRMTGYASVFNSWSEDLGGFREMIAPGAFSETLDDDVRALWDHNPQFLLGRTTNDTLSLKEDSRGLAVSIDLPDTSYANDVLTLVRRGDLNQMSFGFSVLDDTWPQDDDGRQTRVINKVKLYEVSAVTFPAYPQTSIEARDKAAALLGAGAPIDELESEGRRPEIQAKKKILSMKIDLESKA